MKSQIQKKKKKKKKELWNYKYQHFCYKKAFHEGTKTFLGKKIIVRLF